MNFSRTEKRMLLLGGVKGGRKDPKLFKKYFQTDHWQEKKKIKLALNPTCELCRRRKATQVHHTNYSCFFNENVRTDLIATCAHCHKRIS